MAKADGHSEGETRRSVSASNGRDGSYRGAPATGQAVHGRGEPRVGRSDVVTEIYTAHYTSPGQAGRGCSCRRKTAEEVVKDSFEAMHMLAADW